MNAYPAALTARTDRRLPSPRRDLLFRHRSAVPEEQYPKFNRRRFAMQQTERKPLFDLGQLVATPGALAALEKSGQSPMDFLSRHATGDWGELSEDDRKENQFSLEKGFRLLSSYRTNAGDKLWVITEGSRCHTTILIPEEY
jgi:hypothetical protein